jgi:hypothetical protein
MATDRRKSRFSSSLNFKRRWSPSP